ncbi:metal ABC transporter substrate-binding protein [Deinococcus cellulosilyticus]|uniref:Metal ABC transporter substrate-binding protein n=1 Tax=Deinococcus cellulosilyticus (strain DSM 18568 / NBRC 106333 / KACC 11606 / 5516J-15) TaxID=1223518 RepID=A0A511MXN4_DEIC1|nr:metal ABC transporter substrate-binding protein [Deinococcus cellulosilyticus]GEM44907.1 metal ABC transporter substrate-binding protein [Deinococcus cellulosilyticus NBRC 106333 = KACC 11606]
MKRAVLFLIALGASAHAKTNVVVTIQPYYSIIKNIAGDRAEVTRMVPVGASPETFSPAPADIKTLSRAQLVFMNGLGLDEWLTGVIKNSGTKAKVLEFGEVLKFKPILAEEHAGETEEEHHDEHGHEGTDPHIFLDASLMALAATRAGAELARVDPKNAAYYQQRAKAENQKLLKLHAELKSTLGQVKGQNIVTFHGAFNYFARAYGLKVAAAIEPFPGKEPSARYVTDVVKLIRSKKVKAVFAEPQLPETAAKTIAESAGVKLFVLDPEGSKLSSDYYGMMRYNRDTLLKALK